MMPSKDAHMSAMRLLVIGVKVILENHIFDKCFEIICLTCTYHIMASRFFDKREHFSCYRCSEHSYCIALITVADCGG